jgi:uncharacterized membrane protein
MFMKILITIIVVVASVFYPIIVYFGLQHINPAMFSLIFLAMAILRFYTARDRSDIAQVLVFVAVILVSLGLLITGDEHWLKLYPVVMSASIALVFALSLRQPESLIERIARSRGATMTPRAKHYTRRLTIVWVIVLTLNAMTALYLAEFAHFKVWAFYCGFLSYVIIGFFVVGEWFYRKYYIAKYGA